MATLKGWTSPDKAVFGQYGAGTTSDKTNLESSVILKRNGVTQPSESLTPTEGGKVINFPETLKGDIIQWTAKTLCDNDPTSDRVNVTLSYYDPIYIGKLTNRILEVISDADMVKVMRGDSTVLEPYIENELDVAQAIKQVYSTTVITDSDGKAAGEIPFPENYLFADYILTIHYGYSGVAERTDKDKAVEFWTAEVGLAMLEIGLIAISVVFPIIAPFAIPTAVVVGGADIAVAASMYLSNGFGAIDENRRGCLFPATGWNQTYNFILDEPILVEVEDPENPEASPKEQSAITTTIVNQITPETLGRIESIQKQYGFSGVSTGAFLGIIGLFGITAALILLRGGKKDE